MKNICYDVEHIYAVGDIHGEFNTLANFIVRYELCDSLIICCGDCGLGFTTLQGTKNELFKLKKRCSENNIKVVMVRGNHDDPQYYKKQLIKGKYIVAVPDYTVINDKILCIGGATSIDRTKRIASKELIVSHYMKYHPGVSMNEAIEKTPNGYWEDELPVYDEKSLQKLKDNGIEIKHVVTHTCPSFCDPTHKDGLRYWARMDDTLFDTIDKERSVMDKIYNKLVSDGHPIETWTYGHYHRHSSQEYDGIRYVMLDGLTLNNRNIDCLEIIDK